MANQSVMSQFGVLRFIVAFQPGRQTILVDDGRAIGRSVIPCRVAIGHLIAARIANISFPGRIVQMFNLCDSVSDWRFDY
jgi:hypothetical protein